MTHGQEVQKRAGGHDHRVLDTDDAKVNVNTDNALHQTFTTPGRVKIDAGFPYAVRMRSFPDRAKARVESQPGLPQELGQQTTPNTNTYGYSDDGAAWPGDVDYSMRLESNRNWYGGQYPSIPQGGVDILGGRRDIGGLPGSVDVLPNTNRGPVESNTMEDFTLYGDVLRLTRPNVAATGPVIGGRDWKQQLSGAITQSTVEPPLTVDVMRLFLMNQ